VTQVPRPIKAKRRPDLIKTFASGSIQGTAGKMKTCSGPQLAAICDEGPGPQGLRTLVHAHDSGGFHYRGRWNAGLHADPSHGMLAGRPRRYGRMKEGRPCFLDPNIGAGCCRTYLETSRPVISAPGTTPPRALAFMEQAAGADSGPALHRAAVWRGSACRSARNAVAGGPRAERAGRHRGESPRGRVQSADGCGHPAAHILARPRSLGTGRASIGHADAPGLAGGNLVAVARRSDHGNITRFARSRLRHEGRRRLTRK